MPPDGFFESLKIVIAEKSTAKIPFLKLSCRQIFSYF
jgi:hypothetical protein